MRNRMWIGAMLVAASLAPRAATGQTAAGPLGVDDIVGMEKAGGFTFSPGGKSVAWARTTIHREKNIYRTNIELSAVDGSSSIPLTRGDDRNTSPRFSPDGKRVAFLSDREKDTEQIYLLDLRGGEAQVLTRVATGVKDFDWISNGALVYTAREDSTLRERRLSEDHDNVVVVADAEHYPPVRLYRLEIEGRKTTHLTRNEGVIESFAVSPDHRWVVTSENVDVEFEYNYRNPPHQYLIEIATGDRREICTEPHNDPYDFTWAADGRGFYCRRDTASDTTQLFVSMPLLYYYDLAVDSLARVATGWAKGLGEGMCAVNDGLVVALADGVRDRIAYLSGEVLSPRVRYLDNEKNVELAASHRDGKRVLYFESTATSIPDLVTAVAGSNGWSEKKRLVGVNEALADRAMPRREIVRWAGARGDSVEGILYYPLAWEEGRTWPCIAWIHGGPSSRDTDIFDDRVSSYPCLMAARGAFVLQVNYHGSDGYGLDWLESIKGHYYELEVPDILSGLDALIARGLVDSSKQAIMGWSNGAILAIQCCVESNRFEALCAGAGDVNWTSDYGNCAFGAAFDEAYIGAPPWKMPATYVDKSPLFQMEKVTTPTLIMFGEKDTSVPTEQGWQHFRAMRQIGAAPVRFLLFPGATHGLAKPSHRARKMNEELAWLDRYLFGTFTATDEVVAEGSPLALQLAIAKVARVGSLYGREVDASLVPEIVPALGVNISRFEVTNAQFASFDPNFSYPEGQDNYPVTGISVPMAETFCLWLGERTGATYRLPTEKEMDRFLEASRSTRAAENNLDRWAGYSPTPEETDSLSVRIQRLEQVRTLLEPVGSFPASVAGVYDIGGNAAEWVKGADGDGYIRGPSALTPADGSARARPPLGYIGFRVVRNAAKK